MSARKYAVRRTARFRARPQGRRGIDLGKRDPARNELPMLALRGDFLVRESCMAQWKRHAMAIGRRITPTRGGQMSSECERRQRVWDAQLKSDQSGRMGADRWWSWGGGFGGGLGEAR